MTLFQLLTPALTTAIMTGGHDVVSGAVVVESEATFADADAARAAFGHPEPAPGAGRFADFLLLPTEHPVLDVADGWLAPTRAPSGASFWRLEADGSRHVISYYDTPAFGWRNGRGPVRPASDVGLRARWRDLDVVAAFEDDPDEVHLVALSSPDEDPPEGFAWTKTGVSRHTVPVGECELYERVVLAMLDGAPARVVDRHDGVATVQLERPGPRTTPLAPDWHEARVAESELADLTVREVPRG